MTYELPEFVRAQSGKDLGTDRHTEAERFRRLIGKGISKGTNAVISHADAVVLICVRRRRDNDDGQLLNPAPKDISAKDGPRAASIPVVTDRTFSAISLPEMLATLTFTCPPGPPLTPRPPSGPPLRR